MKIYNEPQPSTWETILARPAMDSSRLNEKVQNILTQVKENGDAALKSFSEQFDKVSLKNLQVSVEDFAAAENELSEDLKKAIQTAYTNIEKFHASQISISKKIETMQGVTCWQKSVGIEKVGLYIPGGTAPLFSTILMLGIPAKVASCKEVVICTPPQKDGTIHPAMLYAARLAGIEKVFKVGGAQAIGAMTYGTETVPKVYKIFGPGNQFVTCAKQLVSQQGVAIDMPAGPSEVLVVADDFANPSFVAADLLSQAEHGEDSQVVLVASSDVIVNNVLEEIQKQLVGLPRQTLATKALENSSSIILQSKNDQLNLINEYAPEHLIIATKDADEFAEKIINAGSVFIGNYTPESVGDYASGTNHTLPTNGFAKAYSGVNLDAFVKKITFQKLTEEGLQNIGATVELMADAEELQAHKNAITLRLKEIQKNGISFFTKNKNIQNFVRPNILKMTAYSSARSEFKGQAEVFLDANENPFNNDFNRYPDPLQKALKEKISQWRNIPSNQIFLGNGSDEAIDILIRIFCEPSKDSILTLPPTYGMYKVSAATSDIKINTVSLDDNFQPEIEKILNATSPTDKILFLCSPNNPTGNNFDLEKMEALIKRFNGIVVVDEAYIDFSQQETCISLLEKFNNLVILQTFSKAWGLAGIRLGMAFASTEILDLMNKVKPPYNINQLTQQVGLQAFDKTENFQKEIQIIVEQRTWLTEQLKQFDFIKKIYPSDANFILVKTNAPNEIYDFLIEKNIIVRNRSTQVGCEGCLRLTIGKPEENQRLINALNEYTTDLANYSTIILQK